MHFLEKYEEKEEKQEKERVEVAKQMHSQKMSIFKSLIEIKKIKKLTLQSNSFLSKNNSYTWEMMTFLKK